MSTLVIVESPTKAKTISKYLPKGYKVLSSMGHIRDLPSSAKEIPAKYKGEKWANLGVNVEKGFEPLYVIPDKKKKTVKELKAALKNADELVLATDEDREGEAISWHLLQILKPKVPVKRMVFHEITKEAILHALENFREVDTDLVYAQEARRVLDRLAGYTISPVLWKKIAPKLSAGRVQSVAVALLVDRERDRMRFKEAEYWDVAAKLEKDKLQFPAQLITVDEQKIAQGNDFDKETGKLKTKSKAVVLGQKDADEIAKDCKGKEFVVVSLETKDQKKHPAPPFITSTLQQEAGRKLRMSARDTMRTAQRLYEQGYITYMRTDSVNLSGQAISAARKCVESKYGKDYLSEKARQYATKSKGAQEAHEAIRPAGTTFKDPGKTGLKGAEYKLYELIWQRTVATQMAPAELKFTSVILEPQGAKRKLAFQAKGKQIVFPGFIRAYVEGSDNPDQALDDQDIVLPKLAEKDTADCKELTALSHFTKPPSRYTEASLIKALETNGVGRPSTYASIISTIQDRGYVEKINNALVPTFTALAVTQLLEQYFPDLVNTDFTAAMEEMLDKIAEGQEDWQKYLEGYYLGSKGIRTQVDTVEDKIDPAEARKLQLPMELDVEVCVGRYGPYIQKSADSEERASIPQGYNPSDLTKDLAKELMELSKKDDEPIGNHPETGEPIYLKVGRYGPYVQLGEVTEENKKPKRGSLLKGMQPEEVDVALAVKLLSLPRLVGEHPDTGKEIRASVGRFGPYIVHDGDFRSLKGEDHVLEVDLKRALEILAEPKKGRGKRAAAKALKELGKMPDGKEEIKVLDGRYGPYLKCGKTNVAIPKGKEWKDLTLEEAIELVKAKRG